MGHFIRGKRIAWDTETTGLNPWKGDAPFAVSFCNEDGDTHYFEWPVDPFTRKVKADRTDLKHIKRILEDPEIEKIGHNLMYDAGVMNVCHHIVMAGKPHDTAFAAHVCNPGLLRVGLKLLCRRFKVFP